MTTRRVYLPIEAQWEADKALSEIKALTDALQKVEKAVTSLHGGLGKSEKQIDSTSKKTSLFSRAWAGLNKNLSSTDSAVKKTTSSFGFMSGILNSLANEAVQLAKNIVRYLAVEPVKAASALQEMTNKFEVVFRGQEEIAYQWAENLVNAYAMSTREARQFMGSMMDLLKPMGVNQEMAAAMSYEITKLAADIGSFNDQPTADVMRDIQSAMVGNVETVRKYGIALNESIISQEAMNLGFSWTTKAIPPVIKSQAIYSLILKGSADAQGDMARSSDSYANTLKRAQSTWENFTAMLGEKFLPVLADVLNWFTYIIKEHGPQLEGALTMIADGAQIVVNEFWKIYNFFVNHDWFDIFGVLTVALTDTLWKAFIGLIDWIDNVTTAVAEFLGSGGEGGGKFGILWRAGWDWIYRVSYNTFVDLYNGITMTLQALLNLGIIPTMNKIGEVIQGAMKFIAQTVNKAAFLFPQDWIDGLNRMAIGNKYHFDQIYIDTKTRMDDITDNEKKALNIIGGYWDAYQFMSRADTQKYHGDLENMEAEHYMTMADLLAKYGMQQQQQQEAQGEEKKKKAKEIGDKAGKTEGKAWKIGFTDYMNSSKGDMYNELSGLFSDLGEELGTTAGESAASAMSASMNTGVNWSNLGSSTSYQTEGGMKRDPNDPDHLVQYYQALNYLYWRFSTDGGETWSNYQNQEYSWASGGYSKAYWGDWPAALKGGIADIYRGIIQSYDRGGVVPAYLHHGEGVIPTRESGSNLQGLVMDGGRVSSKKGGIGDTTINIYLTGELINGRSLWKLVQVLKKEFGAQIRRNQLPADISQWANAF